MHRPTAVLLDSGGVLLLPDPDRIAGVFARCELTVDPSRLPIAHYRAASTFGTDRDVEADWAGHWRDYVMTYAAACGVEDDARTDLQDHLASEFADAALWSAEIPRARAGLAAVAATGVRIGIVSNADGLMAARLRELEILQVGPGPGIEVGCVIDSGVVGVMKPDPRIFEIALTALDVEAADTWYVGDMPAFDIVGARASGVHGMLLDPLQLHDGTDYDRVDSLGALADRIAAAGPAQVSKRGSAG